MPLGSGLRGNHEPCNSSQLEFNPLQFVTVVKIEATSREDVGLIGDKRETCLSLYQ